MNMTYHDAEDPEDRLRAAFTGAAQDQDIGVLWGRLPSAINAIIAKQKPDDFSNASDCLPLKAQQIEIIQDLPPGM